MPTLDPTWGWVSEWATNGGPRKESKVAALTLARNESATTFSPVLRKSPAASPSRTNVRAPGGYLAWVRRLPGGRSMVYGCRIHHTVESSIVDVSDLTTNSRIDSYEPPVGMNSDKGSLPFAPPVSVYTSNGDNPKIVCLSSGIEMFSVDSTGIEVKPTDLPLNDRPTRITAGKLRGQNVASACLKMMGGNVMFCVAQETADKSSSSSSESNSS